MANWLDQHWESFFNQYQPQSHTDYFLARKFMEEGSCATLASLHRYQNQVHWLVYGDAVALCFQPAPPEIRASITHLALFDVAPHLINWQTAITADGFRSGVWQHQSGQQYALLSDALGQYVLMAFAAFQPEQQLLRELARRSTRIGTLAQAHISHWSRRNTTFSEAVWLPLRESLLSAERFLAHTLALRRDQLLSADDYTCVLIEE